MSQSVVQPIINPIVSRAIDDPGRAALLSSLIAHFPLTRNASPEKGTGLFTAVRAGSGTYEDPDTGDVVVAASNEIRIERHGAKAEESRTNQVLYSTPEAVSTTWGGAKAALTPASGVEATPGYATAAEVVMTDVSTGDAGAYFSHISADSAPGYASIDVVGDADSSGKIVDIGIFDFTTMSVLGVASFVLSETPQRIGVQGSATTAGNACLIVVGNLSSVAYGGSSNLENGHKFYIDFGQYETGVGGSSRIITTGTAATRVVEHLKMDTANLPAYTADMTLALDFKLQSDVSAYHGIWNAVGEAYRECDIDSGTQRFLHFIPGTKASANPEITHGVNHRYKMTYDADGDWNAYLNNTLADTDAVGVISGTMTDLFIGSNGTYPIHGWVKNVKSYDRVLLSTELASA